MDALKPLLVCLLMLVATLFFNVAHARPDITLVTDNKVNIAKRLQSSMASLNPELVIKIASSSEAKSSQDYIVLLGQPDSAQEYTAAKGIVAVFISDNKAGEVQANAYVYVEPPLARQIRLANRLVPGVKPLGVILPSQQSKTDLQDSLPATLLAGLKLVSIEETGSLNQALYKGLKNSRALLGVYDTEIYNAANIKNILITSYRQNKVLVGPSKAYLKAGSYATTFSNIDDVARRTLDILSAHQVSGRWDGQRYNPYFRILINKQVARSLNLTLPDIENLKADLEEAER